MNKLSPEEFACLPENVTKSLPEVMQAYADHCKKCQWISVDESLPDLLRENRSATYIVRSEKEGDADGCMFFPAYYSFYTYQWWCATEKDARHGKITHWHELSPFPNEAY